MVYVFENFSIWLLAALIVGLIVGWLTWSRARRRSWFAGWALWGAIAFGIGVIVALLRLLPGRSGLWLETALLSFIVYIAGCFLGGWLNSLLTAKPAGAAKRPARRRAAARPRPAARLPDEDQHEGRRPRGYATARRGRPDDLELIK